MTEIPYYQYLEHKIVSLDATVLQDLLKYLMKEGGVNRRRIAEWLKANKMAKTNAEEQLINDNLLAEYWEAADRIIMRFIENDGGPERKLSEVYDWLDKVSSLLAHESLSSDAKIDFVDEAVWEFGRDTHGDFMDKLSELFFQACSTVEEWKFLIKQLEHVSSDWSTNLQLRIYREKLQDEESYVRVRSNHLEWGIHYWELVQYYKTKNLLQKAREIAEQGMEQAEGNLEDLFKFLRDLYTAEGDASALSKLRALANKRDRWMLQRLEPATAPTPEPKPTKPKKQKKAKPQPQSL